MDEEPTKSTKYYDEAGEVEIISSDNVAFRIPAYHLQGSSDVFRAMIDIGSGSKADQKPIQLDDVNIESSSVIEFVLDMINQFSDICKIKCQRAIYVIMFLIKYEFDRELELVRLQSRAHLTDTNNASRVFVQASHLKDYALCNETIGSNAGGSWAKEPARGSFGAFVPGAWSLDPTAMPLNFIEMLPSDCMWALCRSIRQIPLTGERFSPANRKLMADEFERLMKLLDAPNSAGSA